MKVLLEHVKLKAVLVLLIVGLVSCTPGSTRPNEQTPVDSGVNSVSRAPQQHATLIPSQSIGLYIEMYDQYSGAESIPGNSSLRKGLTFYQRVYVLDRGKPITVTVNVLVFDSGELRISDCELQEFQVHVVNRQGQEVPLTPEGQRILNSTNSRQCITSLGVDRNSPFIQSFRVDKWYDLSSRELYTMTVSRWVQTGSEKRLLEGNHVRFRVETP